MARPDVEVVLVAYLGAATGVRVLTETPPNLQDVLPVIQVVRVGGADDGLRLDEATVDVDVYAATRSGAAALAEQVREALTQQARSVSVAGAVITGVRTLVGPRWLPQDNPALRRSGATYQVWLHPSS